MKFCGEMGRGPGRNRLDFGDDPDSFVDHFPEFFTIIADRACSVSQQVMNGFC